MAFFFLVDPEAGRGSFYDAALPYDWDSIAGSRVKVTARKHAQLMAAQSSGAVIEADSKGRPVARQVRASRDDVIRDVTRQIKREAARRINQRMPLWRQINALRDQSDPGFHEIDAIRASSNLIEQQIAEIADIAKLLAFDVGSCPLWPEFEEGAGSHA